MKKLLLSSLYDFLKGVSSDEAVYLPVDSSDGEARFTKYSDGLVLSDKNNTLRSAKDFFFPQTENIVSLKLNGKKVEIEDDRKACENFVIFGVKACDYRSFGILDKVFLADPVDSFYKSRREKATIITFACNKPETTCFCMNFGIDPSDPDGDVACWKDEKYMYFKAKTQKGEDFLSKYGKFFEEAENGSENAVKESIQSRLEKLPLKKLNYDYFKDNEMKDIFASPLWDKLSSACLGCGTCTFVCPTCQCFDIKDFDTGHGIKRFRCWDSCMYADFTKTAGGQPRPTQKERFRQRFMHKLVYFPSEHNGEVGCVGCGRCLKKCPVKTNIVKVIRTFGENNK